MTMQQASIVRPLVIALLLVLAGGAIYNGFDAVGKQALVVSAVFQKNANLAQRMGMMPPTQHPYPSHP
jgi:hypothetical protein